MGGAEQFQIYLRAKFGLPRRDCYMGVIEYLISLGIMCTFYRVHYSLYKVFCVNI